MLLCVLLRYLIMSGGMCEAGSINNKKEIAHKGAKKGSLSYLKAVNGASVLADFSVGKRFRTCLLVLGRGP